MLLRFAARLKTQTLPRLLRCFTEKVRPTSKLAKMDHKSNDKVIDKTGGDSLTEKEDPVKLANNEDDGQKSKSTELKKTPDNSFTGGGGKKKAKTNITNTEADEKSYSSNSDDLDDYSDDQEDPYIRYTRYDKDLNFNDDEEEDVYNGYNFGKQIYDW